MATKKKLGEILVEAGLLDEHRLRSALGHQRQWGGRLGEILVSRRFVSEDSIAECLASQLGLPRMDIYASGVETRASRHLPADMAETHQMLPVKLEGNEGERGAFLWVATADPTNIVALDEVRFRTGKPVRPVVVTATQVRAAIRHAYHGEPLVPPRDEFPAAPSAAGSVSTSQSSTEKRETESSAEDIVHEEGEPISELPPASESRSAASGGADIDDDLALLGFESAPTPPSQEAPRDAVTRDPAAVDGLSNVHRASIISAIDSLDAASRAGSDARSPVSPEQVVTALVRLLIRKGVIGEAEIVEELRRK